VLLLKLLKKKKLAIGKSDSWQLDQTRKQKTRPVGRLVVRGEAEGVD